MWKNKKPKTELTSAKDTAGKPTAAQREKDAKWFFTAFGISAVGTIPIWANGDKEAAKLLIAAAVLSLYGCIYSALKYHLMTRENSH